MLTTPTWCSGAVNCAVLSRRATSCTRSSALDVPYPALCPGGSLLAVFPLADPLSSPTSATARDSSRPGCCRANNATRRMWDYGPSCTRRHRRTRVTSESRQGSGGTAAQAPGRLVLRPLWDGPVRWPRLGFYRQLTGLASGGDWIGGRYQKRLEAAMRVAGSGRRLNGTEQRNEDVVHSLEYRLGGLASGQRGLHDPMEAVKEELDAEGRISDA